MIGDAGADTIKSIGGDDILLGGAGDDALDGGNGNDVLDGGDGNDTLYDGSGNNTLRGGAGDDTLTGDRYAGNNTFEGGTGDDVIKAGIYTDQYVFGLGDGHDTVTELGGTDTLTFGEAVTDDQLWFERQDNDLEISIIGTDDTVTIKNWSVSSNNHIESIATSDGHVMRDTQVDALVSAMASFSPPEQGQMTLPESYKETLTPVIAANWH